MQLLDRVSSARGITKSDLVEELLETVREPLERVVVLIEMAKKAPAQSLENFKRTVLDFEAGILPLAQSGIAQMDMLIQQVSRPGTGATGDRTSVASSTPAAPRTGSEKGGPPLTNRGVPVGGGKGKVRKISEARKARKAKGRGR
jgi:hypothetical protein